MIKKLYIKLKDIFLKISKFIKSIMWLIELLLAFFAIFIAYPEYKEFIEKNNVPNINGQWQIEFKTEESSFVKYN
jgi:hypothetical protein